MSSGRRRTAAFLSLLWVFFSVALYRETALLPYAYLRRAKMPCGRSNNTRIKMTSAMAVLYSEGRKTALTSVAIPPLARQASRHRDCQFLQEPWQQQSQR